MHIGFHLHGHSVMLLHHWLSQQAVKFSFSWAESMCRKEHLMTRLQKDESLTKIKDVHLRMSKTEYEIFLERANTSNMTVSDFIRNALDNQNVIIKYERTFLT